MNGYEIIKKNVTFDNPGRIGIKYPTLGKGDMLRLFIQKPRSRRRPDEEADMRKKARFNPNEIDEWGCMWGNKIENDDFALGQPITHPIEDWETDYENYKVPDPYDAGRFDGLEEALAGSEAQGQWVQLNSQYCIFERLHFLRGFENTLVDFYTDRENLEDLCDKLLDYQIGIAKQAQEIGKGRIHCFETSDDWGTQNALMVEPQLWRDIFKPRYKKLIEVVHDAGMFFTLHSCGKINEIIEDLIEIGVDIVNIHQPRTLGIKEIGEKFAGRICFDVSVDIQDTLPTGNKELIEQEVKDLIEYWATPRGGLIAAEYRFLNSIGATHEDFVFSYECFEKYGKLS